MCVRAVIIISSCCCAKYFVAISFSFIANPLSKHHTSCFLFFIHPWPCALKSYPVQQPQTTSYTHGERKFRTRSLVRYPLSLSGRPAHRARTLQTVARIRFAVRKKIQILAAFAWNTLLILLHAPISPGAIQLGDDCLMYRGINHPRVWRGTKRLGGGSLDETAKNKPPLLALDESWPPAPYTVPAVSRALLLLPPRRPKPWLDPTSPTPSKPR